MSPFPVAFLVLQSRSTGTGFVASNLSGRPQTKKLFSTRDQLEPFRGRHLPPQVYTSGRNVVDKRCARLNHNPLFGVAAIDRQRLQFLSRRGDVTAPCQDNRVMASDRKDHLRQPELTNGRKKMMFHCLARAGGIAHDSEKIVDCLMQRVRGRSARLGNGIKFRRVNPPEEFVARLRAGADVAQGEITSLQPLSQTVEIGFCD